ncbi:MAG TPA: hypothetical protein VF486_00675 [Actinomycetes bacterium]
MSEAGAGAPTGPEPRGAVRLTFRYEGDEVRLVSSRRLDKLVPPDPDAEEAAERRGFFAEVRGADGSVLHRRLLHPPVRRDAEVFSDDPQRSLGRVPVERPSGVFSLVVPDLEEADHVALVERGAPERPGLAAAPGELIRVPLRGPDGPDAGGAS